MADGGPLYPFFMRFWAWMGDVFVFKIRQLYLNWVSVS